MRPDSRDHGAGLVTSRVDGHDSVHLHLPLDDSSLCGLPLRSHEDVASSFRAQGCLQCLSVAHECGYTIARDRDQSWINLARMQTAG